LEVTPWIDHIQITVGDLARAEIFYDKVLPILGFDPSQKGKGRVDAHDFDVIEYSHKNVTLGINSPRESERNIEVHRRRPGSLHHLAFRASSKSEVDEVYQKLKHLDFNWIAPPQYYPQHGEKYYALFFKDPDGIKLEVMFEPT
jgi:catechol 2,3-dioxygenase-like lactoylglutathione lyase family enzyme